jgi:hypothetical protein
MVSMEKAQTTNTRSSRCKDNKYYSRKVVARDTDDECGELLPVSGGKVHHGFNDLYTSVGIDVDAALIRRARNKRMRGR